MHFDISSLILGMVAGIIIHRVVSSFYDLGQIGLYIIEVEKNALIMLATVAESISYIQTIKHNTMSDLGLSENLIKTTKNVDNYNFDAWKNAAVSNLLAAYPEKYKNFPRYVDWSAAMKYLDKIYKQGLRGSK
tara:strand:+ start:512 stop:910 length:399 start_codon:yes stop_codon:yes gene_type:complete